MFLLSSMIWFNISSTAHLPVIGPGNIHLHNELSWNCATLSNSGLELFEIKHLCRRNIQLPVALTLNFAITDSNGLELYYSKITVLEYANSSYMYQTGYTTFRLATPTYNLQYTTILYVIEIRARNYSYTETKSLIFS